MGGKGTHAQGLFGELFKPEPERNQPRIAELRLKAQRVGQILAAELGDRPYFAEDFSTRLSHS